MGTWGAKLYQDDIAEDVRDYFKDQLKRGKKGREITEDLITGYEDIIKSDDEAEVFWLALADTQWNLGRLEDYVKEKALYYIHEGRSLQRWKEENPGKVKIREKVLNELENKLLSEQPQEKYVAKYKLYQCEWKIGDVYACALENIYAEENNLKGEYILLHKVDEYVYWPGHVIPIVRIKITQNKKLPENIKEFDELSYLQISEWSYEDVFYGPEGKCMMNDVVVSDKHILKEMFDKMEFLPNYQLKIICRCKKNIPKKVMYVGNFQDAKLPNLEFIPDDKVNLHGVEWKDFEETIMKRYKKIFERKHYMGR